MTGLEKFELDIQELLVICMLQMLITILTVLRDFLVIKDNNKNRKVTVTMSRNADSNSDEAFTDVVKSLEADMSKLCSTSPL